METGHECAWRWERAVVVARGEGAACEVDVVALVLGEGVEVLSGDVETYAGEDTIEPFIFEVVAELDVGYLPVVGILDEAVAEVVVVGGAVGSELYTRLACVGVLGGPAVEHIDALVGEADGAVESLVEVVDSLEAESAVGGDSEVETLPFYTCVEAEVNLRHAAAEEVTVVLSDDAIAVDIDVVDIAEFGVSGSGVVASVLVVGGVALDSEELVESLVVADDAAVAETVEAAYLFAYLGAADAVGAALVGYAESCDLVLVDGGVSGYLPLDGVVVVAVCGGELEAAVLHGGGVHSYGAVGCASACGHGDAVEEVFGGSLEVVEVELNLVREEVDVETDVESLLLLPLEGCIDVVGEGGASDLGAAEAVGVVATGHGVHVLILADVLVAEDAVGGADLEEVDDVAVDGEELLTVEAPASGDGGESLPAVVGAESA